jgi:hypothetical protein
MRFSLKAPLLTLLPDHATTGREASERAPPASDHITAIRLPRFGAISSGSLAISSGSLAISSGSLIGHPHSNHYCNSECGARQTPISQAFLDAPEAER